MVKSYTAHSLEEAVALRAQHSLIPYGGGTDLMIEADENAAYLFLHSVPEMKNIADDGEYIRIGASVTFTELLESKLTPALLREAVSQIAAPAIRNMGTVGGNIGNGSAKADSALIFWLANALLRLVSVEGERLLPVREFYFGHKKTALGERELIAEILLPKAGLDGWYYQKVGARDALAISRVAFAGLLEIADGVVQRCAAAFGAVSDVYLGCPEIDAMLVGKTVEQARKLKEEFLAAYDKAIQPRDGRISAAYRKDVCRNLLRDFLDEKLG